MKKEDVKFYLDILKYTEEANGTRIGKLLVPYTLGDTGSLETQTVSFANNEETLDKMKEFEALPSVQISPIESDSFSKIYTTFAGCDIVVFTDNHVESDIETAIWCETNEVDFKGVIKLSYVVFGGKETSNYTNKKVTIQFCNEHGDKKYITFSNLNKIFSSGKAGIDSIALEGFVVLTYENSTGFVEGSSPEFIALKEKREKEMMKNE